MKISRAFGRLLLISLLGMPVCFATMNGWYAGLGVGHARGELHRTDFGSRSDVSDVKIDASGMGGRVFSGYQVNPNFAVEAGYSQYAKINVKRTSGAGDIKTKAVMLNAVGLLTFSSRFGVYTKGGIYRTDRSHNSASIFSTAKKKIKDETGVTYSLGGQFSLSEEVALAVNFEKLIKVSKSVLGVNNQLLTGNLIYYFG